MCRQLSVSDVWWWFTHVYVWYFTFSVLIMPKLYIPSSVLLELIDIISVCWRYPWKTEKPQLTVLFPNPSLVAASWTYISSTQHLKGEWKAKPLGLDYPYCNFKYLLDVTLLCETNCCLLINKQYLMMSIFGKLAETKMMKIAIGRNDTLIVSN